MPIKYRRFTIALSLLLAVLIVASIPSFGQRAIETIDATAFGTSTQMGRNFSVKITIFEFSTPEDREVLVKAFQQGQNEGLVDALSKMRGVGRITIPGKVGYELSFTRQINTPNGRIIRFVTNRVIAMGEAYWNTDSKSFNLTAGEIRFNDKDKNKSEGVLFPATQLVINNEGELQFELRENPWKLVNIIDWK